MAYREVGSARSGGKRRRARRIVSSFPEFFAVETLDAERYPGASSAYIGPPRLDEERSVLVENWPQGWPDLGAAKTLKFTWWFDQCFRKY